MSKHTIQELIGDYNQAVEKLNEYLDEYPATKLYFSNGPSVFPYAQRPIQIRQYETTELNHVE